MPNINGNDIEILMNSIIKLGKWCGLANNIGSENTYYILNLIGVMITRLTITHLSNEGNVTETMRQRKIGLDTTINEKIGNYEKPIMSVYNINIDNPYHDITGKLNDSKSYKDRLVQFIDSSDTGEEFIPFAEDSEYNESISAEVSDKLIWMRILLPYEGEYKHCIVRSRKKKCRRHNAVGKGKC